jgi:hypothetical protein
MMIQLKMDKNAYPNGLFSESTVTSSKLLGAL